MNRRQPDLRRAVRHHAVSVGFLAAFVLGIEHLFGWSSLLAPWGELGFGVILGILALMTVTYLTRGMRLYRFYQTRLGFLASLRLMLQHNLWIMLLPARAGEVAFPILMQRHFGISAKQSLPVLIWFRLLDVHALLLVVGLAFIWDRGAAASATFASAWIAILIAAIYCRPVVIAVLDRLPGKLAARSRDFVASAVVPADRLAECWFWTMISWTIKLLLFAWIISAFTSLSLLPSMAGALGGEISSALPVHSIGGFGTYHTGVASALLPFDVSVEDAVQGGVNLHLVVLGGAVTSGLLAYAIPRTDPGHGGGGPSTTSP